MSIQVGLSSAVSTERVSARQAIQRITKQYHGYTAPSVESCFKEMEKPTSLRELVKQVRALYIKHKPEENKKVPDLHEQPLTQEQMAVAVANDMSGKSPLSSFDRFQINNNLYLSIRKMVYQLAGRYSLTCPEEVDDLAQDCMYRIIARLRTFNPAKAKFTTWSWYVCRSVLNKKYRLGQKMRKVIVGSEFMVNDEGQSILENMAEKPADGVPSYECPGMMALEIMDAVRELAGLYPKHRRFIFELLGNPDSEDFVMPSYISVSEASKAIGMDYGKARIFYSKTVRPFLKTQFAGC
jgi:DNA-directed RNA polymerase specialized sigma24 family protein